jgi:hypothetical protein
MGVARVGTIAAVLLAVPITLAAETLDTTGHPTVVIRTFNYFKVSGSDLQSARVQAEDILRDAGIGVSWQDCPIGREAKDGPAQCSQALGANDLILRIGISGGSAEARYVAMGFSLVNPDEPAHLATVYADLVARVARDAGLLDARELLGRAIAHEIGHLLLGTNRHAATGLMRAIWSRDELRRQSHVADWRFLANEAQSMRAAVATRQDVRR